MEKIIIGIDGDDSFIRKKIENFTKFAKQKGKQIFSSKDAPKSSPAQTTGQSPGAQRAQEARDRQRIQNDLKKHSMVSYMQAGRSHISKNMEMGADLDELKGGGFYNVFAKRLEGLKTTKDWMKDRYLDIKEKRGAWGVGSHGGGSDSGSGGGLGGGSGLSGMGGGSKAQTINIQAQTVNLQRKGGVLGGIGSGLGSGGGDSSAPSGGGGGGEGGGGRGGLWAGLAKAMPYLGIPMAIGGGLMQLASSAGQRYGSAVGKQTGTWNALGGYVGGGGGYFANSEVAQGTLAFGKTSGVDVYRGGTGRGRFNEESSSDYTSRRGATNETFMKFASSQGESLSTIMQGIGTFTKQMGRMFSGQDLEQMRGIGYKAGFKNLRESEFFSQIANYIDQSRKQGFGDADPMKFASFSASLQGSNITEDRRVGIASTLEDKGRKNVLGGGLFGNIGLVEAMKDTGGDFFAARRAMQKDPSKYMQSAMEFFGTDAKSKEIMGFMAEKEGIGPQREMETLEIDRSAASPAPAMRNTQNPLIASENLIDETYVSIGKPAFDLSQKMIKDMAGLVRQLHPAIEMVSNELLKLEEGFKTIGQSLVHVTNATAGLFTGDMEQMKKALRKLITGF
jgi:hypothetical protein